MKSKSSRKRNPVDPVVEEIPDAEHELVMERVAAIDVAKASGKVCAASASAAGPVDTRSVLNRNTGLDHHRGPPPVERASAPWWS